MIWRFPNLAGAKCIKNLKSTINNNDVTTGHTYEYARSVNGTYSFQSSGEFENLTNNTAYTFKARRRKSTGSCQGWVESPAVTCTPAASSTPTPSSCTAQTISNCALAATASGSSSGTCATGYTGSCSYTCSNGSWSQNSNSCTTPSCTTTLAATWTQPSEVACGTTQTAVCTTGTDSCGNTLQCPGSAQSITGTKCTGSDQYCDGSSCVTCAASGGEGEAWRTFTETDVYSGNITEYEVAQVGGCTGYPAWKISSLYYEYNPTTAQYEPTDKYYCSSDSADTGCYLAENSDSSLVCSSSPADAHTSSTCAVSSSFYDGYWASWACECGDSRKLHSEIPYPSSCVNSGDGCSPIVVASNSFSTQECSELDSNFFQVLGPINGPSTDWTCEANYTVGSQGNVRSCSSSDYPQGGICCHSGYRCDGNYLQYYSECKPVPNINNFDNKRTLCDHGCLDPSDTSGSTSSGCHGCTTDSDCGSGGTCVTGSSSGVRYCERVGDSE